MLEKRCLLMKTFGWTPDFIRKRIPGAQGWAYYYWALEREASFWGGGPERKGKGYVQQQVERLRYARRQD